MTTAAPQADLKVIFPNDFLLVAEAEIEAALEYGQAIQECDVYASTILMGLVPEAFALPVYGDDRKPTGETLYGIDAIHRLDATFGQGAYRRIGFDPVKAFDVLNSARKPKARKMRGVSKDEFLELLRLAHGEIDARIEEIKFDRQAKALAKVQRAVFERMQAQAPQADAPVMVAA